MASTFVGTAIPDPDLLFREARTADAGAWTALSAGGTGWDSTMETLSLTAVQAEFHLPSPPSQCSASSAAPYHRR